MGEARKRTILIVEDEALIAMMEKRLLERNGYAVISVSCGDDAVAEVQSNPEIDLILMDIDLGSGMDGTEAAEIILREHDIPLAFLSSHTEPEIVEKTEGITSYGYIVKNSGDTVLLASVRMAFRLHAAHLELKNRKEHLNEALAREEYAKEQLLEKNEELERYFSSSLDLLCIANTEGEFVRVNPEWERVLGYAVSELEGQPFLEFVHEADREATKQAVSQLKHQDEVRGFENRYRCRDGSFRWIEWRSKPMGSMVYAAARDVTDRKQAEEALRESELMFRSLMENSIDAVQLLNEQGEFLDANLVAHEMLGYTREEILSLSIADIDPNYPDDGFKQFWDQQPEGSSVLFETLHRHKDGRLIPVEVNGIFFELNGKRRLFGVARDLRVRRENEEVRRLSSTDP